MNSVATEQLWIDFGLDYAVFLDYIAHWLHVNSKNKQPRNFHDGRYWTYNTLDTLHSLFPGWSRDTIRGIIRKCVKNGLLIVSNFNKKKYDRTCWYTLSDLGLKYYPKLSHLIQEQPDNPGGVSCGDLTTPSGQSTTPIPNNSTTCSNNTITTSDSAAAPLTKRQETVALMLAMIAVYREVFPDNPQPHPRLIATSLQKTLQALINRWPEADPEGRPLTIAMFERYLTGLKELAPKFSLGEYTTADGNKKKNNMETFCRWNTLVKFLENQYS